MSKDPHGAAAAPAHARQLSDSLLSLKAVTQQTSFSPATVYRRVADGTFPKPIKFGAKCTRWRASDIAAWMAALGEAA